MVEENSGSEAAECNVRRDFGGGKGAALRIRQAWREQGRRGGSRVRGRDRWASVFWDGDR